MFMYFISQIPKVDRLSSRPIYILIKTNMYNLISQTDRRQEDRQQTKWDQIDGNLDLFNIYIYFHHK